MERGGDVVSGFFSKINNAVEESIQETPIGTQESTQERLGNNKNDSNMSGINSTQENSENSTQENPKRNTRSTQENPKRNTRSTQEETLKLSIAIVRLIKENASVTRNELAEKLSVSPNAIKKHLAKLRRLGYIEHVGPTKGGYWRILK